MLKQFLNLKLSQKLSPQQIQLMKLIQLPTQAFEQRLKEEMDENPALESGKEEEEVYEKDEFDNNDEYEDYEGSENIETEKSIEPVIVNKKKKKERKIVYYAVSIENELFEKFENVLKENDKLIKLEKIHSTLIFFKNHDPSLYEECKIYYSKFENMQVNIDIVGYGISENAFALDVSSIKCEDEEIKSYAVKQHITMALKKEIKAFESVKTFLGEGTVVKLDEPLKITGFIKPYYW